MYPLEFYGGMYDLSLFVTEYTNNSPWLEEFIVRNGLGEFTGAYGYSGFCSYPQYRFYPQAISRSPKNAYRVEYLERGRWKKLEDFDSEDEAYECMED